MISVPWQTPAVNQNAAFFAESWPHRAENTPADRENRPAAPPGVGEDRGAVLVEGQFLKVGGWLFYCFGPTLVKQGI